MTAALLISTCSAGSCSCSSRARRRTCASWAKSACTERTSGLPLARLMSAATLRARAASRPCTMTVAQRGANARAVARPTPCVAPVTTQILSFIVLGTPPHGMVYERCPTQRAARVHGVDGPPALAPADNGRCGSAGVNAVASAFLLTFAGLFPIVNPLEAAPFFLALTAGLPANERSALARRIAMNGFALLLGSMALGPWLLEVFGIELPVVRIAGGLVVAALGWKLLTQEQWSDHGGSDLQGGPQKKIGSFYPLTLPLTVGPGSMSVAITIGSGKPAGIPRFSQLAEHATGAVLGVLAIAVTIYLAYRFAENIARLLGETGLEVLVRLSAFILMCIGIEIVWSGYSALTGAH